MDPYRSYYPDQFLEETSDLLNLDPSQLPDDDDFGSPSFSNSAPPPAATPYGLQAYFAAAPVDSPASAYFVNGNLPSYAAGANGSYYSSADGNTAPPPSWADPSPDPQNPQSSPAQTTALDPNSSAAGYLTPELLQMLLPIGQPPQSENPSLDSDLHRSEAHDWHEPNQGSGMSAAAFEASQASRSATNGDLIYS